MIEIVILIIISLLFLMVLVLIIESYMKKQTIFGRPSIPLPFFIMAKTFPFITLVFLFMRGLKVELSVLIRLPAFVDYIALSLMIIGLTLAELTSIRLKKDLVFGLSDSEKHKLQTKGVYTISRHPFYVGFLLILISSVLFVPNIINILLFVCTWILHHFIMINEEKFLTEKYGDEYREYLRRVNRYLTFYKKR